MEKKKHFDRKQFIIGIVIMLGVWAVGIFASGILPYGLDYVDVSEGYPTLSFLYPFFLVIYSVIFAAVCKRKSKDAVFAGSYLILAVPTVVYLIINAFLYLEFTFFDDLPFFVLTVLAIIVSPILSVLDGFLYAVYGDVSPEGFTEADMVFCVVIFAASALSLIVFKLVKSKRPE